MVSVGKNLINGLGEMDTQHLPCVSPRSEEIHMDGEQYARSVSLASPRLYSENLSHWPLPPLWPKRSASGVAGRRFRSGQ